MLQAQLQAEFRAKVSDALEVSNPASDQTSTNTPLMSTSESFIAHLIELRKRLLNSVMALAAGVHLPGFLGSRLCTPCWRSRCWPSCPRAGR